VAGTENHRWPDDVWLAEAGTMVCFWQGVADTWSCKISNFVEDSRFLINLRKLQSHSVAPQSRDGVDKAA
jgi:hypothetical protein